MHNEIEIKILKDHFNANGWPYDLTPQKFMDRVTISSSKSKPDRKIVEIERHRPILGVCYTVGLPMSNFETYSMRYAVNVSTSEVEELSEKHQGYTFDIYGLVNSYLEIESFHLTIKPVDKTHYKIFEYISKESEIVSNLEEAKKFVDRFIDRNVKFFEEHQLDLFEVPINDSQKEEYRSKFKEYLEEALVYKVEDLWYSRNPEE